MSFLRYAKSKYRHQQPLPRRRPRPRPRPVWLVGVVALVGVLFIGAASLSHSDAPQERPEQYPEAFSTTAEPSDGDVDALIRRAEQLHRQKSGHAGDETEATDLDGDETAALPTAPAPAPPQVATLAPEKPKVITVKDEIHRGEALSIALRRHGATQKDVAPLIQALKKEFDPRRVQPGDTYVLEDQTAGAEGFVLDRFELRPHHSGAVPVSYEATRQTGEDGRVAYAITKRVPDIVTKVDAVSGEVNSSLYVAMKGQGEGSGLVSRFVDVFAWNIDFYRETQKGDTYKVIVEKKYADGSFIGYGKVLAAEYVNAGQVHRGFNFKSSDKKFRGIYDDKGHSLERTFLKSPLEIARITSRFGQRFHPVLKRWRAHKGVDYGAQRGTPFWTVADGVIVEKKYSRTAGNMIVVRHAQGYTTEYFHASKFKKGLKVGQKVRQRDVIGYVGTTGRSTGPHLHFGMKRRGKHVAPSKQKFPNAKPIPKKYVEEFTRFIAPLRAELEALTIS